ncbi:Imidazoleglycerol-phosphate dehydratase [Nakaseomyces glabratus]
MAFVKRVTQETNIQLALDLDGGSVSVRESILGKEYASGDGQTIHVHTGVGFLDHMLTALAKHGGWSLILECIGTCTSMTTTLLRTVGLRWAKRSRRRLAPCVVSRGLGMGLHHWTRH